MISIDEVINKIVESFKGRALEAKLIFQVENMNKRNCRQQRTFVIYREIIKEYW